LAGMRWEIRSMSPSTGYCGAVAVEEALKSISCWMLPESWNLKVKL
jgi:hypothetical protein